MFELKIRKALSPKSLKTVQEIAFHWSRCSSANIKTYRHQNEVTFGSDIEEPKRPQRTQSRDFRIGFE